MLSRIRKSVSRRLRYHQTGRLLAQGFTKFTPSAVSQQTVLPMPGQATTGPRPVGECASDPTMNQKSSMSNDPITSSVPQDPVEPIKSQPDNVDGASLNPYTERELVDPNIPTDSLRNGRPQTPKVPQVQSTHELDFNIDADEQLLGHPAHQTTHTRTEEGPPMEDEVACSLHVIFKDTRLESPEVSTVKWLSDTEYQRIENAAYKILHNQVATSGAKQLTVHRKTGVCRLLRTIADDRDTMAQVGLQELKSDYHWKGPVRLMVGGYWAQNPYCRLRMEITYEYAALSVAKRSNQKYRVTIKDVIWSKLKNVKNWEGKHFLPRRDVETIFGYSTIRMLVEEDDSLKTMEAWSTKQVPEIQELKERFVDKVSNDGTCLLATCIYADVDLICLYNLIEAGKSDVDMPLTTSDCPNNYSEADFMAKFLNNQHHFKAFDFGKIGNELQEIPVDVNVPIMGNKDQPWRGGFADVYKVQIHGDHHTFSDMEQHPWPASIKQLGWPSQGITYSYEHRGYVRPEKVEHWLKSAFGSNRAKYAVSLNSSCGSVRWSNEFGHGETISSDKLYANHESRSQVMERSHLPKSASETYSGKCIAFSISSTTTSKATNAVIRSPS